MAGVGLALIHKVITERLPITFFSDNEVEVDSFQDKEEKEVFTFIVNHSVEYGQYPDPATIEAELSNITFGDYPNEPVGFYLNRFKQRNDLQTITDTLNEVRTCVDGSDVEEAKILIKGLSLNLERRSSTDRIVTIEQVGPDVLKDHADRQRQGQMKGVPFGIQFIDQVSDGAQATDTVAFVGRPGVGKCLAKNTKVLMYDGSIEYSQNVLLGDKLMGPDSKVRRVKAVTTGEQEMFWVTPKNGEAFGCNRDHVLSLWLSGKRKIVNISVDDYFNSSERFRARVKLWKTEISYPKQEVPYDPYIIGLYLAEGGTTQPTLSLNGDDSILHIFAERYFTGLGYRFVPCSSDGESNCQTYRVSDTKGKKNLFFDYIRYVLFNNGSRRLPEVYRINSKDVRLSVLAGILDGDGSVVHNCYDLTTKYPKFAEDVAYLARSLGFKVTVADSVKEIKSINFVGFYKRLTISGNTDRIPCKLKHKQCSCRKINKNPLVCGFDIKSIGTGKYFGFDLDGDHLFVLGDFTVTHNSYLMLNSANFAWDAGNVPLFATYEMAPKQCVRRILALRTHINATDIRMGRLSHWGTRLLSRGLHLMEESETGRPFYILQGSLHSTAEDLALRVKEYKPSVLYVDGAYLLKTRINARSKWEMISDAAEWLKDIAMDNNIPVIASYQFNRKGSGDLGNIGYSDTIGQLASIVIGIANEAVGEIGDGWEAKQYKLLELLKGREGEKGIVRVLYDMQRMFIQQDSLISGFNYLDAAMEPDLDRLAARIGNPALYTNIGLTLPNSRLFGGRHSADGANWWE